MFELHYCNQNSFLYFDETRWVFSKCNCNYNLPLYKIMVSYFLYLRFFSRYNTSSTSIYHYKISLFGVINLLLHRNFNCKKDPRWETFWIFTIIEQKKIVWICVRKVASSWEKQKQHSCFSNKFKEKIMKRNYNVSLKVLKQVLQVATRL